MDTPADDIRPVPSIFFLLLGSLLLIGAGLTLWLVPHASDNLILGARLGGGMGLFTYILAFLAWREERAWHAAQAVTPAWPGTTARSRADAPPRAPALPQLQRPESLRIECRLCGYQAPATYLDDQEVHEAMACRTCRNIITVSYPRARMDYPLAAKAAQHHARERCASPDLRALPDVSRVSCPRCTARALHETHVTSPAPGAHTVPR